MIRAQFYVPLFLRLPGPLETLYWSNDRVAKETVLLDQLGLFFGAAMNIWFSVSTLSSYKHVAAMCIAVTASQVLHFGWAIYHSRSHWRWRLVIAALHRIRWMTLIIFIHYYGTTEQLMAPYQGQGSSNYKYGSWRAFFTLITSACVPGILSNANINMPFRWQLVYAIAITVMFNALVARHVLAAVKMLGLLHHVDAACLTFRRFLAPAVQYQQPSGTEPMYCSPGNELLFLTFLYMLLAGLLPLALTYWHEYCSKRAFLRCLLQLEDDQHHTEACIDIAPGVGIFGKVLCCWASLSICWSTLGIMYGLAGSARMWLAGTT